MPEGEGMTLRPYQAEAVDRVIAHIRKSTAPCLVEAATGAGKSLCIASLAEKIHSSSGKRVLVMAPSGELVTQNAGKYLATGNFEQYLQRIGWPERNEESCCIRIATDFRANRQKGWRELCSYHNGRSAWPDPYHAQDHR